MGLHRRCCRRMESDSEKETDMTPNLTGAVLKYLFGIRLLPDIAAVIFHEYPKERQLELIEACCAKEHEALLATPAPVYPGLVDALSILSRHYPLYIVSNCQAGYIEVFLEATGSVTISEGISVLAIPERQRQTTSVQSSNRTICSTRSMSAIPTATTRRHTRPESRLSMPHTVLVRPKPGLHHHFPDGSCHTVRTGKLIFNSFFLIKIRIPVLITECVFLCSISSFLSSRPYLGNHRHPYGLPDPVRSVPVSTGSRSVLRSAPA